MTPYRGRRVFQGNGDFLQWEEDMAERALESEKAKRAAGEVFSVKKIGWLEWAVMEIGSDGLTRISMRGFWRWIDAARAQSECLRIRNDALWECGQHPLQTAADTAAISN